MSQQRGTGPGCAPRRSSVTAARWSWLAAAAGFVFLAAPGALAQPADPAQYPDSQPYYRTAPQNLETLAQRLDELALQTRNQARMDRRSRNEEVSERLDTFASHAHQFRALMRDRHVPASKINDQVRRLVDDARNVQSERMKASWRDPHVDADWNATLAALDNLNHQYLVANNLAPEPLNIPGYTPQYTPGYGSYEPNEGAIGTSGYAEPWSVKRSTMLADLDRRADDAVRLSQNAGIAAAPEILRLRDEVRSFRERANSLSFEQSNADVRQMLSDARAVQSQLATRDVPAQLRDDVNAMVGTLVHMRDMTRDAEGNRDRDRDYDRDRDRVTGYENQVGGVASDRYATMDVPQLSDELARCTARASQIASQAYLGDLSSQIANFRDKVHDFNNRVSTMDRDDRRGAIADLLHDAQNTQRDLARRNAPTDLVNQWNAVVDLLARLRDAS